MRRIEWMAVGWGGLFAAIGLLIGAGRDTLPRLVVVAVAFAFGGFLAGVRADDLRPVHGALAAFGAYAFHAVFVSLTHLVDIVGGPGRSDYAPGPDRTWLLTAALGVACAALGALAAAGWLRPQRDRRRRVA